MSFNIAVEGGKSVRLLTAGKYCDRDIVVTAEGGGYAPVAEKDVNFYDYDGTLLYSYTVEEAQALAELPPAPTPPKDFLVFEEWNWTLAQIKDYNDPVQVGAIYKPVDNNTRAVIQIDEDWQKEVVIRYKQWSSTVTINWGDGSAEESTTDSSGKAFTLTHTYPVKENYVITVKMVGTWDLGHGTATTPFFGNLTTENGSMALREVYLGGKARVLSYAFYKARKLNTATLSKTQTAILSYGFRDSLIKAIVVPSTLTSIGYAAFYYAKKLNVCSLSPSVATIEPEQFNSSIVRILTIPKKVATMRLYCTYCEKIVLKSGLTEIGQSCFSGVERMTELTIPETVTSIGTTAFKDNYSMLRLRFLPATPPTVANSNAFTGIPANCVVEVPAASLEAYKNATNYGTIAAQMVGV